MTTTITNCATGTLAPYQPSANMPWDRQRATHLVRRLGFGTSLTNLDAILGQSPTVFIDAQITEAANTPAIPEPFWGYWSIDDYTDYDSQRNEFIEEWLTNWFTDFIDNPLRGKLSLFWSNHLVTELDVYDCPSWLYQYHLVLQTYQFGNYREFVRAMGKTPAMIVYLNSYQNTKNNPNENYARELFELFTMGADNGYTQTDIEEAARALTGFTDGSFCGSISFNPADFDNENKTIFGQTGNWGYDDVVDIVFEQRSEQIANYICGQLYQNFVHHEINEVIVAELAQTFLDNDFELEPVYRQLFKSEHFFDADVMNVLIKSPMDLMLSTANEMAITIDDSSKVPLLNYGQYLGQAVSSPPSVAGWSGNRAWISTSLLTARWQIQSLFPFTVYNSTPQDLVDLAIQITGDAELTDPDVITEMIVDYFIPGGLTEPTQYERATIAFKADVPQNYFDLGWWNWDFEAAPLQVALLLVYIGKMPEYQIY